MYPRTCGATDHDSDRKRPPWLQISLPGPLRLGLRPAGPPARSLDRDARAARAAIASAVARVAGAPCRAEPEPAADRFPLARVDWGAEGASGRGPTFRTIGASDLRSSLGGVL